MSSLWQFCLTICVALLWTINEVQCGNKARHFYVTSNYSVGEANHLKDVLNKDPIAFASWSNEINNTGWAQLEITATGNGSDSEKAYWSGFLEGLLSADLIADHYWNTVGDYCINETDYCQRLQTFLQTNLDFMLDQVSQQRSSSTYWNQVGLLLEQLTGIQEGFRIGRNGGIHRLSRKKVFSPGIRINVFDEVYLLNAVGDLMDLELVLNRRIKSHGIGQASCTGIIKLTQNASDLIVGHNSWFDYKYMLRVVKQMSITFNGSSIWPPFKFKAKFTSYPGLLFSFDDFYLIPSSGLVVLETTNNNYNQLLWNKINPASVLTFLRTMIANRLADSGKSWTSIFSRYNSGTYNNQFMVIDYRQFHRNGSKDLLWILEQMPGIVVAEDLTNLLVKQTYWASYNIPYFEQIYNVSGTLRMAQTFGDYFGHETAPRAKIIRRDHHKVEDILSFLRLLRYNDFKVDPLSACGNCTPPFSGTMAIAARADLNDPHGKYPFKGLSCLPWGAIDAKLTSVDLFQSELIAAISGPTFNPLPPFIWSQTPFGETVRHRGHPDEWIFDAILV